MKTVEVIVPFTGKFILQLTDSQDDEAILKEALSLIEKKIKQIIDQFHVYNIDIDQTSAQIVERM